MHLAWIDECDCLISLSRLPLQQMEFGDLYRFVLVLSTSSSDTVVIGLIEGINLTENANWSTQTSVFTQGNFVVCNLCSIYTAWK